MNDPLKRTQPLPFRVTFEHPSRPPQHTYKVAMELSLHEDGMSGRLVRYDVGAETGVKPLDTTFELKSPGWVRDVQSVLKQSRPEPPQPSKLGGQVWRLCVGPRPGMPQQRAFSVAEQVDNGGVWSELVKAVEAAATSAPPTCYRARFVGDNNDQVELSMKHDPVARTASATLYRGASLVATGPVDLGVYKAFFLRQKLMMVAQPTQVHGDPSTAGFFIDLGTGTFASWKKDVATTEGFLAKSFLESLQAVEREIHPTKSLLMVPKVWTPT